MSSTSSFKFFPPGIHGPSVTFEDTIQQDIDWPTQKKHFDFMISHLHGRPFPQQICLDCTNKANEL